MDIYLIRHGRTAGNLRRCYSGGGTDEPVTAEGEQLLSAAGVRTDVSRVYVSPMLRTRRTAAVCYPNAEQICTEGLREMNFGDFDGRTADEMADDPAYSAWVAGECMGKCPGEKGESIGSFSQRVGETLTALIAEAAARGEKRLVLVTHGGVIMALMYRFAGSDRAYYDWLVDNGHGYRVTLDPKNWEKTRRFTAHGEIGAADV